MLPVVALVGCPNVGKSTLFNRLTHTRDAIVSPYPGTTRDRQYGEATVDDRKFIVIDTGGLADIKDTIHPLMLQQTKQAIEEASIILLMIDGQVGVTNKDKQIAKELRKLAKPLFLVVNKAEGLDPETGLIDAYELGLETFALSALHGMGISTLIYHLFPQPTREEKTQQETGIVFALIGQPNAGKSTLANRMLGEEKVIVHDTPGTTRDSIYHPFSRYEQSYTLIDTAGIRKRKKRSEVLEKFSVVKSLQAIERADVVLYIIDAHKGISEQDLKLLGFILECGKALVIAMNKWDGLTEDEKNLVKSSIDRHLDFVNFARIHFISALHGSGVGNLFDSLNEAYLSANKQLSTPLLTRLLQQATHKHTPPLVQGRRVKLRYAHPGGHNPPCIIIHGNQLLHLPLSYKRYLAKFFQKHLELHGTPINIKFKVGVNPYLTKKKKK